MLNIARSLFGIFSSMNTRVRKTVIDRMTAEVIVDVIKSYKSSERKRQHQISFVLHSHCFEVYASSSAISFIVKYMTTMVKAFSLYMIIWVVYENNKRIMNKVMMLSNFDYHESNAFFIQKIIEKIEKRDILMRSRSVIVRFNLFKDFTSTALKKSENWNEINELIKQWLIDKRKNIIVEMIIKYENKSEKESFDSLEKIEFSSKTFVLISDNFDDKFFFFWWSFFLFIVRRTS